MRPSTIDAHPKRGAIVDAILAGDSVRKIAAKYGVSPMSVQRYRTVAIPTDLAASKAIDSGDDSIALAIARGRAMFRNVNAQAFVTTAAIAAKRLQSSISIRDARNEKLMESSVARDDPRGYAAVAGVAQRDDELVAKISGLLAGSPEAGAGTLNLVIMPTVIIGPAGNTQGECIDVDATSSD